MLVISFVADVGRTNMRQQYECISTPRDAVDALNLVWTDCGRIVFICPLCMRARVYASFVYNFSKYIHVCMCIYIYISIHMYICIIRILYIYTYEYLYLYIYIHILFWGGQPSVERATFARTMPLLAALGPLAAFC